MIKKKEIDKYLKHTISSLTFGEFTLPKVEDLLKKSESDQNTLKEKINNYNIRIKNSILHYESQIEITEMQLKEYSNKFNNLNAKINTQNIQDSLSKNMKTVDESIGFMLDNIDLLRDTVGRSIETNMLKNSN